MISKKELLLLIEPHFYNNLKKEKYEVINLKANQLLTHNRFDLAFKLFYMDIMNRNNNLAQDIYKKHIQAFTLGEFNEPGNKDKNSYEKFIIEFESILNNIKDNGFNNNKTLIPLSKNGSIANGAHRVASAIYFDKNVSCINIDISNHIYNYLFFYNRNVSINVLDIVATKFIEYAIDVHIAFIWPIGIKKEKEIERIIPNIVYKKEIKLTPTGAHNLLSQIYYGEEWLGSIHDDFKGSKGKLVECFKTFDSFKVIAFQSNSLDEVLKIKDEIRELFNIGKHSVHITDTKEEAIRVARVVFNGNSLHFLNYAKPNRFISTHKKIEEFKKFLKINKINNEDIVIDSSFVLACYGIREAKDTDFLCQDNNKIQKKFKDINLHDEELKYYNISKNELIYDPKNYFYFNDIKFLSFDLVYKMKKNRSEKKDKNDCNMMEAMIENNKLKEFISKIRQKMLYSKIKLRAKLMIMLKNIGLYNIIKSIVRGNK